jgi:hypothetical protein
MYSHFNCPVEYEVGAVTVPILQEIKEWLQEGIKVRDIGISL